MDLDSVELLEQMKMTLRKLGDRIDKLESGNITVGDVPKLSFDVDQEYDTIAELLEAMGLSTYLDQVRENIRENRLAGESFKTVLHRLAGCETSVTIFKRNTPKVYVETDGQITINLFWTEHVSGTIDDDMTKFMTLLIQYCYEKKYWDKLDICVTRVVLGSDGYYKT